MNKSLWLYAVILSFILIVASCMGAETKIKIQNDGSGTILFSYRISRMLLEMGKSSMDTASDEPGMDSPDEPVMEEEDENSNLPLPITKEDFKTSIEGIEGLEIIDVTQDETEKDIIITAKLKFKNVEALSRAEAFSEWPITFEKVGNTYVYSQVISEGMGDNSDAAMDEETIKMMESMFEGYEFSFSVEAPSPIKEHSIGELSPDKKTLYYTIPVGDMMRIKERLELVIKW
ncbi:MAG: hypothetical protein JXB88_13590 [Spirochaetales bacterium]|nr:hypothetical protein [Spirochaetales bacterium]